MVHKESMKIKNPQSRSDDVSGPEPLSVTCNATLLAWSYCESLFDKASAMRTVSRHLSLPRIIVNAWCSFLLRLLFILPIREASEFFHKQLSSQPSGWYARRVIGPPDHDKTLPSNHRMQWPQENRKHENGLQTVWFSFLPCNFYRQGNM